MVFLSASCMVVLFGSLLLAAWRDLATRTLPDGLSFGIAAAGVALRLPDGLMALGASLAMAVGLFLFLVFLHARGGLGGGDVKLLVALALGLPPLAALELIVATTLAGGVLALAYLALRRPLSAVALPLAPAAWLPRRVLAIELRRIRRGGPLPYAVAIAAAGFLILLSRLKG